MALVSAIAYGLHVFRWSNDNNFKLNSLTGKHLRIDFRRKTSEGTVIEANGNSFETIKSAKVLSVTVRGDLKWNDRVGNITVKASQRIYLFKQLKGAGIDCLSLIHFYYACIRSVLECASQAFHSSLPVYLSDQIERIQMPVLRIIYPEASFRKVPEHANLKTLFDRREELCVSLFSQTKESDGQYKLADLPPVHNKASQYNLRNKRMSVMPGIKTKRFQNSFIMHHAAKEQM